jgi:hypothetical protein
MDKAEILGLLFKAYIEKEITYIQFRRLSSIIARVFTDDLILFVNEYNNIKQGIKGDGPSFIREELSNVGLMCRPEPLTSHSSYEITQYGDKLFEVVLKDRFEENK